MLTNAEYKVTPDLALEGQPLGERETRPRQLAQAAEIIRLTVAAGATTDDLVVTVVDDKTQQSYSATATGSANEATLGANLLAAVQASEIDKIFSVAAIQAVDASDLIVDFTARHGNRDYTLTAEGGTGAITVLTTQTPGGSGLEFGRMVAKGADASSFAALGATSTARDMLGLLFRTDANHFHSLENDTPSAVDVCEVGKHYSLMTRGRCYVKVEEAVTQDSRVWVRRALTSSAGRLGGFRASPAGAAQVSTVAPIANGLTYAIEFGITIDGVKHHFDAEYTPTDGTTAVADAIDGLYDQVVESLGDALSSNNGLGISVTESDTLLTLTTDAGLALDYLRNTAHHLDTEAPTSVISVGTADVDAVDVSDFCEYESSASTDGLALLRIRK